MRRVAQKVETIHFAHEDSRFGSNVETFKRRNALRHFSAIDASSQLFFDRIVNVKKIRELVFVTKASARTR